MLMVAVYGITRTALMVLVYLALGVIFGLMMAADGKFSDVFFIGYLLGDHPEHGVSGWRAAQA